MNYDGQQTAVIYGFMRDIATFKRDFGSNNFVFCFDHGWNRRKNLYSPYKGARPYHKDPILKKAKDDCEAQIRLLKEDLLKELGFTNIFYHDGYEADDLIARAIYNIPTKEPSIIFSGDKDIHQLLQKDSVSQYAPTPKKLHTEETFIAQWKVTPHEWHKVKAIAGETGDTTDNIPGVPGVAEKTAVKYLRGELNKDSATYKKIENFLQTEQYQINLRLVTLPFDGCPDVEPKEQELFPTDKWDDVCRRFGMHSLLGARVTYGG